MWEAKAEYSDGSSVERYFADNARMSDSERQFQLEEWLLQYRDGCVWYSVTWIPDDED
ncbi:MAG: hypothetical protein IKD54_06330 [Clostridia bacterium]|nr:hypothetical protein [Clostridia bacterium]